MDNFNTITKTGTYTVVDIRKTFEGFEADLRMIARRTGKWNMEYVEKLIYDVLKLAEGKYIKIVNIALIGSYGTVIRAVKYIVNEDGKAQSGERPGNNDWNDIPGTSLQMILEYKDNWHNLSPDQKAAFMLNNGFKINWTASVVDTSYRHLAGSGGQLYGSNGYELKKQNYK